MAFSNQSSCIITDSKGNLYTFLWSDKGIEEIFLNKALGKTEKRTIVSNCSEEFDVVIDNDDMLYLVYQLKDGRIEFISSRNGVWNREELVNELDSKVLNLELYLIEGRTHIFYCEPKGSNNRVYNTYHSIKENNEWNNSSFVEINVVDILNPLSVVKHGNDLLLGYYNIVDSREQLFLKKYNLTNKEWGESAQLTFNPTKKLYLDMIGDGDDLHITYTEQFNGNYIVKYEKHILDDREKVSEHVLSNPSNVGYPTFVVFDNKLWTVWTENENILSSYTDDIGMEWTEPYLWLESKKDIFVRYNFGTNDPSIRNNYRLNYSFGKQYPDIAFLGFGNVKNAVKVPLKYNIKETEMYINDENIEKKVDNSDIAVSSDTVKEEESGENQEQNTKKNSNSNNTYGSWNGMDFRKSIRRREVVEDDNDIDEVKEDINKVQKQVKGDIHRVQKEMKEINEVVNELSKWYKEVDKDEKIQIKQKLDKIEKRIDEIEEYLSRRRRGSLFTR